VALIKRVESIKLDKIIDDPNFQNWPSHRSTRKNCRELGRKHGMRGSQ